MDNLTEVINKYKEHQKKATKDKEEFRNKNEDRKNVGVKLARDDFNRIMYQVKAHAGKGNKFFRLQYPRFYQHECYLKELETIFKREGFETFFKTNGAWHFLYVWGWTIIDYNLGKQIRHVDLIQEP